MGHSRVAYGLFVGMSGGRDRLEHPSVVGRIILKWVFKKWDVGLDWINLTYSSVTAPFCRTLFAMLL
jgi:hypothetical protein